MKVVGTGSPTMLTIRVKRCEVGVLRDVLTDRRDAALEAGAAHAARRRAGRPFTAIESEQPETEVLVLTKLLEALRADGAPRELRTLVGPTALLDPIVRGAAAEAAERLCAAVDVFRADIGKLSADQLRAAVEAAAASAATLIGLDHVQNYGVE
jgi:hypothetical protein